LEIIAFDDKIFMIFREPWSGSRQRSTRSWYSPRITEFQRHWSFNAAHVSTFNFLIGNAIFIFIEIFYIHLRESTRVFRGNELLSWTMCRDNYARLLRIWAIITL